MQATLIVTRHMLQKTDENRKLPARRQASDVLYHVSICRPIKKTNLRGSDRLFIQYIVAVHRYQISKSSHADLINRYGQVAV